MLGKTTQGGRYDFLVRLLGRPHPQTFIFQDVALKLSRKDMYV